MQLSHYGKRCAFADDEMQALTENYSTCSYTFCTEGTCAVASTLVLTYTNDSSEEVETVTTLLQCITELGTIGVTVLVGTELITFVTTLLDFLLLSPCLWLLSWQYWSSW